MTMEIAKVIEAHVPTDDDPGSEVTFVVEYPDGRVRLIAVEARMTEKIQRAEWRRRMKAAKGA